LDAALIDARTDVPLRSPATATLPTATLTLRPKSSGECGRVMVNNTQIAAADLLAFCAFSKRFGNNPAA
jgi:hypothetical protein